MINFFSSLVGSYTLTSFLNWEIQSIEYRAFFEKKDEKQFVLRVFDGTTLCLVIEYDLSYDSKIRRIQTNGDNIAEDIFNVSMSNGKIHYKCNGTENRPNIRGYFEKLNTDSGFIISNQAGTRGVLDKFITDKN
jgi:hypothetical protein